MSANFTRLYRVARKIVRIEYVDVCLIAQATSALDSQSEAEVQDALDKVKRRVGSNNLNRFTGELCS